MEVVMSMPKWKKQVIALFLCFALIFGVVARPIQTKAFFPVAIGIGFVVELFISLGVCVIIEQQIEGIVRSYMEDLAEEYITEYPDDAQEMVNNASAYIDENTGDTRYKTDVSDTVFSHAKSFIQSRFVAGENTIVLSEGGETLQWTPGENIWFIDNYTYALMYPTLEVKVHDPWNEARIRTYTIVTTQISSNPIDYQVVISCPDSSLGTGTFNCSYARVCPSSSDTYIFTGPSSHELYWPTTSIVVPSDPITVEVQGVSGIIDNPSYDWENEYTGDRTISVPLDENAAGDVVIDGQPYSADMSDEVIDGRTATDVIAQDVIGIPIVDEDIPAVTSITDTGTGILEGVRALMEAIADNIQRLFNAAGGLQVALAGLVLNLTNLYLWVPSEYRNYIITSLAIALAAVVYKIVRG